MPHGTTTTTTTATTTATTTVSHRCGLTERLVRGRDDAPALIAGDVTVDHRELRERIRARAGELGLGHRSVVLLSGGASLEYVVTYLALLDAGHVPLLAGQHADRLRAAWTPGAVVSVDGDAVQVERTGAPAPVLHPELALLMSTSGSTGSPKLVRLSRTNLLSNAAAIAQYLGLSEDDRAITSLPLHYCYGLSVLHSHLHAGAATVITHASVVDPCFRDALVHHGVTNVAGVPHTFELAERAGADRLAVPSLRFLTVAGGRMHPDAVVRWAERADRWGAELYVMYGQTEATARMGYLPPSLARAHPGSIGCAIPGGAFHVDAPDGEVGELVYAGPNVMLGYAVDPADLALGATLTELRTGDLARRDPVTGLLEIVGRRSRFVKPFGLRIDLDALEDDLHRELAAAAAVAGDDERLACVAPGADRTAVTRWLIDRTGLPEARIGVATGEIPRTANGKVDHAAVLASAVPEPPGAPARSVGDVLALVLGRAHVGPDDSFVSLGGDSLAYVECSIRLEQRLGRLPADWHLLPVAQLDARATEPAGGRADDRPRRLRLTSVDSTVVLRAVAICAVVATHMRIDYVPGGAHILLAVVGYNLSRFMMPITDAGERWRAGLRTAARTAGPALVWMAAGIALFGAYGTGTFLLVNNYVGPEHHRGDHWHFWFIEVFVHLVLLTTALLAVPAVRRAERRRPYLFALGVVAATLVFRYELLAIGSDDNLRFRTHGVAWFFALGWLVHRSDTVRRKLLTTAIVVATVPGFFSFPQREWFVITCVVALVWWREVRVPRPLVVPLALVSSASLWILITHFTVWPPLVELIGRRAAYPLVIAAGVAAWIAARSTTAAVSRRWHARRARPTAPVGWPAAGLVRIP